MCLSVEMCCANFVLRAQVLYENMLWEKGCWVGREIVYGKKVVISYSILNVGPLMGDFKDSSKLNTRRQRHVQKQVDFNGIMLGKLKTLDFQNLKIR